MSDCKSALEETAWDLQKAIDIIKIKELNIVSDNENNIHYEGAVCAMSSYDEKSAVMVELNCQTERVAKSEDFKKLLLSITTSFISSLKNKVPNHLHDLKILRNIGSGTVVMYESADKIRKELIDITKENIIVRRWWSEQVGPLCKVFTYTHTNNKIGVILSMKAPYEEALKYKEFNTLGENIAMQIAAMNPILISRDQISQTELDKQKNIFKSQLKYINKYEQVSNKILDGKLNKWFSNICLLEQESVIVKRSSINDLIKSLSLKLGGDIKVINFYRCKVGE
jgi:elongation factor Ts